MVEKIISGGQTGVDTIGLKVGKSLNISTGGTAPKGYRTENGYNYSLKTEFNLIESTNNKYDSRTEQNIIDSDATIIYGFLDSVGTKLTIKLLKKYNKPYITNAKIEELINFLIKYKPKIINIAGNRSSKLEKKWEDIIHKRLYLSIKHYNNLVF